MTYNTEPVTKVTQIINRTDGTQVKIVATTYVGLGLHISVGVDVFKRDDDNMPWILCDNRPVTNWKELSVAEYIIHGRSEMLQTVSHAEILRCTNMLSL